MAAPRIRLTRDQRDALRAEVICGCLGEDPAAWIDNGHALDEMQDRRERIVWAFAMLDDLGWAAADGRDTFEVAATARLRDELTDWRDYCRDELARGASDEVYAEETDRLLSALHTATAVLGLLDGPPGR